MTRWLPLSWAVVLTVLLLGPALAPGYVILRDMVWVPDLALRPDALGLGSALPRAVPSDAVVAALDEVVPGMLLQKVVLVGALVGAGTGAAELVGGTLVGRLGAVSLAVWNPFVVERLAMGHWTVVLGYAAVPWLAVAGRRVAAEGRIPLSTPLLLVLGGLSANAGLVSAAVLLVTAVAGGLRRRSFATLVLMVVAVNAPWLVAGVLHASAAAGTGGYAAFATRSDGLPGPLAVLTLGGIWNADVVPGSRDGLLSWVLLAFVLVLSALGGRRWWRRQAPGQGTASIVLWLVGVGVAVVSWAAPGALAAVGGHVAGLGLLRDGSRSLGLALPLMAGLVAAGAEVAAAAPRHAAGRWALAAVVALVPIAAMPDVAWGLGGALATADYPADWPVSARAVRAGSGDVLLVPLGNYRAPGWNGGRPVIDPLARLLRVDVVMDDDLVVGGRMVAGEDPRAAKAREALKAATPQARADLLRAMGIGWVVVEKDAGPAPEVAGRVVHDGPLVDVVRLDSAARPPGAAWTAVAALTLAWSAFGALALVGGGRCCVAMITRLRGGNARVRD